MVDWSFVFKMIDWSFGNYLLSDRKLKKIHKNIIEECVMF
jgi:hypothetical protein